MIEEIIDVLFAGKTHRRLLDYRERRTVEEFKKLFAEVMREKYVELKFGVAEKRKEAALLEESIGVLEFVDAWQDEVRHPMQPS